MITYFVLIKPVLNQSAVSTAQSISLAFVSLVEMKVLEENDLGRSALLRRKVRKERREEEKCPRNRRDLNTQPQEWQIGTQTAGLPQLPHQVIVFTVAIINYFECFYDKISRTSQKKKVFLQQECHFLLSNLSSNFGSKEHRAGFNFCFQIVVQYF